MPRALRVISTPFAGDTRRQISGLDIAIRPPAGPSIWLSRSVAVEPAVLAASRGAGTPGGRRFSDFWNTRDSVDLAQLTTTKVRLDSARPRIAQKRDLAGVNLRYGRMSCTLSMFQNWSAPTGRTRSRSRRRLESLRQGKTDAVPPRLIMGSDPAPAPIPASSASCPPMCRSQSREPVAAALSWGDVAGCWPMP